VSVLHPESEPSAAAIGQRVQSARLNAKVSYEALAAAAGVSSSKLHRIIRGEADASAVEIWRIAQITGQPFSYFAGEETDADERLAASALALVQETRAISGRADDLLAAINQHLATSRRQGSPARA
jgi:transcriptional regulator with XRE-family HTH domain